VRPHAPALLDTHARAYMRERPHRCERERQAEHHPGPPNLIARPKSGREIVRAALCPLTRHICTFRFWRAAMKIRRVGLERLHSPRTGNYT
jgi:hypothetical protein